MEEIDDLLVLRYVLRILSYHRPGDNMAWRCSQRVIDFSVFGKRLIFPDLSLISPGSPINNLGVN